ncbi:MAG: 5-(carboxyamino)imidazole ribonucleotide synthase [Acidobacteria bacterium]|nr:5-(carboxyamino)imidazole ribonucleotide synthase [Acidobacteriota bacterium]
MKPILPGATIGVLGSGQLGRMFAIAARQMGYRVHTLSPDSESPAGQVSDVEITAPYEDLDAVRTLARNVDAVTFEFENVPVETVEVAAGIVPVRPAGSVLHVTQHRIREKTFLRKMGLPTTRFSIVRSLDELHQALSETGCPSILKTADFGYDGKGQVAIDSPARAEEAWATIGRRDGVLEAFVDFDRELSLVAVRGDDGSFAHYGLIENRHRAHILDLSYTPARVPERLELDAIEMARTVMEQLQVVGVLCVEFFLTRDGRLLVNELAPRPHNSGHFTLDACVTSQFEQQLRAVCGLPLGSTRQLQPAAMANLLGDLWDNGEPDWLAACAQPEVKLHLYGKLEPRRGRKMGHLTALAPSVDCALRGVIDARNSLVTGPSM